MFRYSSLLLITLFIAGCGFNSGSPTVPAISRPNAAIQAPPAGAVPYRVSLKFVVPSADAKPAVDPDWGYISPGSKSVEIVAAGATIANVTPGSTGCKPVSGGTQCIFKELLTYGALPIRVEFFDHTIDANGNPAGKPLTLGQATPKVTPSTKFVAVYQNGFVGKIEASIANANPPGGTSTTVPITLVVHDLAGFVIPKPATFYSANYIPGSNPPNPFPIQFAIRNESYNDNSYAFVENGKTKTGEGLFAYKTADIELRYSGRGSRLGELTVQGTENTVTIDVKPQAGLGKVVPLPTLGASAKMCAEQYGKLWLTQPAAAKIMSFDPKHPSLHPEYTVKSGKTPIGIACQGGFGGSIVYVALSGDVLGMLRKGAIVEKALPTANAGLHAVSMQGGGINATFTEETAGKVSVYTPDPLLGPWYEFPVPNGGHPTELLGEWFSDPANNAVGYVNSTPAAVEFHIPHANAQPGELTGAAAPGQASTDVWFTELAAARIGAINLNTHRIQEFDTAASLRHLSGGWDGWVYATDTKGQIEAIDPKGRATVIGHRSEQLLGIVPGSEQNLWVLMWDGTSSSLLEVVP